MNQSCEPIGKKENPFGELQVDILGLFISSFRKNRLAISGRNI